MHEELHEYEYMKYEKEKKYNKQMFCFLGGPAEPEGLPGGVEQRASHCCRQKRQVSRIEFDAELE